MPRGGSSPSPEGPVEFDEYYRQDERPLYGFLLKLGAKYFEAADTVQETMTEAYSKWDRITNPWAWTRTVAERIFLASKARPVDELARLAKAAWATEIPTLDPEQYILREEAQELIKLLQKVSFQQRRVLAWHLDGFSNKEIALIVGGSEATVASNLRHAKNKIRALKMDKIRDAKAVGRRTNDERSGR